VDVACWRLPALPDMHFDTHVAAFKALPPGRGSKSQSIRRFGHLNSPRNSVNRRNSQREICVYDGKWRTTVRLLGVLLCYNDGDLLEDSIRYLLEQNHDVIVWDHGSSDQTAEVIQRFRGHLIETRYISREFDFYELYPAMSRHLLENYVSQYEWISWPDQDEFLEGPSRRVSYRDSLVEVLNSPCNWIQFDNFNFWFTSADDTTVNSAPERVRHYALFPDCAPRIRSWRSSATNIRAFNHNPPLGEPWPIHFKLRHYPMRSREQMLSRLTRDRAGMLRDGSNYHYENMKLWVERLEVRPEELHYDDGHSELNAEPIFNWRSIYGYGPSAAGEGHQLE